MGYMQETNNWLKWTVGDWADWLKDRLDLKKENKFFQSIRMN